MIEELDRANEIISEFLGMAKNKMVYLQPQYIDQVVKAIYPMLEADANYKEIKIELDLSKPPMPIIDQNEIRQVIFNLARNGMEAMVSGGTLIIGTTVEKGDIVLYVKDEGPGLKPEIIDKIGTPFFTTKEKGTGLGLAVCYSIAARHNARLEFETSPQGTTFKMRFPQHKEV
jgi:signal transduction histidine kinase